MDLSRRELLRAASATALFAAMPRSSRAADPAARLVVVLLRGGLDGLHAVPAWGDPAYRSARGALALDRDPSLALDDTFGLHPSLAPLHPMYGAGELLVLHATATPYRERSHFDAQDVLEGGGLDPVPRDGWLGRALAALDTPTMPTALGLNLPRILRGAPGATAVDPIGQPRLHDAFVDALTTLYADDPLLGSALHKAREAQHLADAVPGSLVGLGPLEQAAAVTARWLTTPAGPAIVTLDVGGWDSHARQQGLDGRLGQLAAALTRLRDDLGAAWRHTTVAVVTEFGRTVATNGTRGTDHGTGGVALLAGGAVRGGRVVADWPGLRPGDLYEGRDLRPTLDVRRVLSGVLRDHLGVSASGLHTAFPGLREAPMDGLVRV